MSAEKRKKRAPVRKRPANTQELRLRDLGYFGYPVVVSVLPKVIDLDWEDNDPSHDTILPSPETKGLYPGDYVVWRNHTDVELVIEFSADWPFTVDKDDVIVAAGSDSSAYKVATDASGSWKYNIKDYSGPPGGPGVTVPSG